MLWGSRKGPEPLLHTSPYYGHIIPSMNSLSTIFLQFYIRYMAHSVEAKTGGYAVVNVLQTMGAALRVLQGTRCGGV